MVLSFVTGFLHEFEMISDTDNMIVKLFSKCKSQLEIKLSRCTNIPVLYQNNIRKYLAIFYKDRKRV